MITPALSAAEWANRRTEDGTVYTTIADELAVCDYATGERALIRRPDALAALCLHGRISWGDVDALRYTASELDANLVPHRLARLISVADLLESLLPPRKP